MISRFSKCFDFMYGTDDNSGDTGFVGVLLNTTKVVFAALTRDWVSGLIRIILISRSCRVDRVVECNC